MQRTFERPSTSEQEDSCYNCGRYDHQLNGGMCAVCTHEVRQEQEAIFGNGFEPSDQHLDELEEMKRRAPECDFCDDPDCDAGNMEEYCFHSE